MDSHEIEIFRGCFLISGNNIRLVTQKGVVPSVVLLGSINFKILRKVVHCMLTYCIQNIIL